MSDLLAKFGAWPQTLLRLARDLSRELWVRVLILGGMALVALGLATLLGPMIGTEVSSFASGEAADRLLSIIANAMLAVTTFSLTVMVTVYRNSSSQFTPRLHRLIVQDRTTQNTLASFIGAYVFALVGIILRELQIFDDNHALVLFGTTVLVLCYVVWSLIRWVLHLQTFGSLMDATRQVEGITRAQFEQRLELPCLGANPLRDDSDIPAGCTAIRAPKTGYIVRLFQESLNEKATEMGLDVYILVHPGSFVMTDEVIAYVHDRGDGDGYTDLDSYDVVCANFTISDVRTYEQDPRFGLIVLGEIASKALSPGINDPGTAIDVITRSGRILELYKDETDSEVLPIHERLWIKPVCPFDLIEDAFGALARDGANLVEVQQRLQSVLGRLIGHKSPDMAEAAKVAACLEYRRACEAMTFAPDIDRLRKSTDPSVLAAVAGDS